MEHNKEISLHELDEIVGGLDRSALAAEEESKLAALLADYNNALANLRGGLIDQTEVDNAYARVLSCVDDLRGGRRGGRI